MHRKSLQLCWRFKQLGENNYYMNYFGILTILLSHITGALYLQKQKYNKLLTACFWGIYALFSVCLMIFQKKYDIRFLGYAIYAGYLLLLNVNRFCWRKPFSFFDILKFILHLYWCKFDFISLFREQFSFVYLYNNHNNINAYIFI